MLRRIFSFHTLQSEVTGKCRPRVLATAAHISQCLRSVGRKDDVISLSTGEKIVPLAQEGRIGADARVAGALMFGRQREQAGILIEPTAEYAFDPSDEALVVDFRNRIWQASTLNYFCPSSINIFLTGLLSNPQTPSPPNSEGYSRR